MVWCGSFEIYGETEMPEGNEVKGVESTELDEFESATLGDALIILQIVLWLALWLFTIGYAKLDIWSGIFAIVIWPYNVGALLAP